MLPRVSGRVRVHGQRHVRTGYSQGTPFCSLPRSYALSSLMASLCSLPPPVFFALFLLYLSLPFLTPFLHFPSISSCPAANPTQGRVTGYATASVPLSVPRLSLVSRRSLFFLSSTVRLCVLSVHCVDLPLPHQQVRLIGLR